MQQIERITAAEVGLDNLGMLGMDSAWKVAPRFTSVHHQVPTDTLYVEPRCVLYWDDTPEGPNSLKRFAYMLGWRGVAILNGVTEYQESFETALACHSILPPSPTRSATLQNLAGKYVHESAGGERITRLATSTARILFGYKPPQGDDIKALFNHISQLS